MQVDVHLGIKAGKKAQVIDAVRDVHIVITLAEGDLDMLLEDGHLPTDFGCASPETGILTMTAVICKSTILDELMEEGS